MIPVKCSSLILERAGASGHGEPVPEPVLGPGYRAPDDIPVIAVREVVRRSTPAVAAADMGAVLIDIIPFPAGFGRFQFRFGGISGVCELAITGAESICVVVAVYAVIPEVPMVRIRRFLRHINHKVVSFHRLAFLHFPARGLRGNVGTPGGPVRPSGGRTAGLAGGEIAAAVSVPRVAAVDRSCRRQDSFGRSRPCFPSRGGWTPAKARPRPAPAWARPASGCKEGCVGLGRAGNCLRVNDLDDRGYLVEEYAKWNRAVFLFLKDSPTAAAPGLNKIR